MAIRFRTLFMWVGGAVALLMPGIAVTWYPQLSYLPNLNLSIRHALAPCLYAGSVAVAASCFESRLYLRIPYAILAVLAGSVLGITFDVVMIMAVALVAGFVAVGVMPKSIIYRTARAMLSVGLAFGAVLIPLPRTGDCPGGGGEITGHSATFMTITYIILLGMIAFDALAWRLRQAWREENHGGEQS